MQRPQPPHGARLNTGAVLGATHLLDLPGGDQVVNDFDLHLDQALDFPKLA